MTLGLAFYIIMLLWLVSGAVGIYGTPADQRGWRMVGGTMMEFLLFLLLGWKVFGPPLHG